MSKRKGELRRGIWVMTADDSGLYLHGNGNWMEPPGKTLLSLTTNQSTVKEVRPEAVLCELRHWPAAQEQVREIFRKHTKASADVSE